MYDNMVVVYLKEKLRNKSAKPYEIIITLISLLQAGKISKKDIRNMIKEIFEHNEEEMIRGLYFANKIIDKDLIDSILSPPFD